MLTLEGLDPRFLKQVLKGITDLQAKGIPYSIVGTVRTQREQFTKWLCGRLNLMSRRDRDAYVDKAGFVDVLRVDTVTNCDGVIFRSKHQDGLAVDIVPLNIKGNPCWPDKTDHAWISISDVMKAAGCVWGGDWKDFPDFPHYQYIG